MAKKSWSDSVEIARPIEDVWAIVADPTTGTRWIKGVSRIDLIDPPPVRVGTRFSATRSVAGRSTTEEIRVTEIAAPTRFAVAAGVMKGGIDLRIGYSLRAAGTGTRVDSLTEAEPRSFGSRLIFGMFWKAVTENDAGNLKKLKSIVEGTG